MSKAACNTCCTYNSLEASVNMKYAASEEKSDIFDDLLDDFAQAFEVFIFYSNYFNFIFLFRV